VPFSEPSGQGYDLIVVGTGFAGSFFLERYLRHAPPNARILVLERGRRTEHAERVAARVNDYYRTAEPYIHRTGKAEKAWIFNIAFGGGTNCWWGNAPRFLPADFEMRSRFGVGEDWPIGYDDLEPYYDQAEAMISLAGSSDGAPYRRQTGYGLPPHRLTAPEKLLKQAYPDQFFHMPTARARTADAGRGVCCANGVCHLCPVDAKFTIQNGMMRVYEDPRVTVALEAEVLAVDHAAGQARGVVFARNGREETASADLVVLAANAIFNPVILQRSSLAHPLLGRRLHEQVGIQAEAFLDGLDAFGGSTSVTGIGYMLYDDEARRRDRAAILLETWNVGTLRTENGKWRQVLPMRLVFDVEPDPGNFVQFDPDMPDKPQVHYTGHTAYTQKAINQAQADLERVLAPLPIESVRVDDDLIATEAHIVGTTIMGDDPATSIVDRDCVHHGLRNLVVLGSSTFPVSGPANPSLTIAAQAMRSADRVVA